jgi:pyruvate dehydrogenase E1 component alpha subunit
VDGNDVFAVYKATHDAVQKAKEGGGPTLIECDTYRIADHTTADDATRYRQKELTELWKARDPILRLRLFMEKKGIWTEQYQKDIDGQSKSAVDEAVKTAESAGPPDPRDLFTYTYSSISQRQARQLKDL